MSKTMSVLKFLIITLLFFLPFGEILRFDVGNDIFIKPLDLTAIVVFFCVTFVYFCNKSYRAKLRWYYFLFPLVGLISLIVNTVWLQPNELFTSFLYLLRWISYLSIFFVVILFDKEFKKKIISLLIADGIVVLVIGYLQFFLYPNLKNLFYLGWDDHLYRLFSSFLDPNFAGAFLVLYLIFIAGLFFNRDKTVSRNRSLFYGFLIIATLIAIFLTYSRSALLMLLVSGVTFLLLLQKRKYILGLIGAMVLFVIVISPYFYLENINLLRVKSSIARIQTSEHALKIIADHPIIGVGFDSYRYAQERYHFKKKQTKYPAHSASGVDMSLLFVFATTGIVGLVAYGYLWIRLYKRARVAITANKNIYAIIFLSSSAGLFINALFINSLFFPAIMLWMWIILGLFEEKKN